MTGDPDQIVNRHADPRLSYTDCGLTRNLTCANGVARLKCDGISFALQCCPGQMPAVAALFLRNSEVPIVIDRLKMPILDDTDGLGDWRRGLDLMWMLTLGIGGAGGLTSPSCSI